MRILLFAMPGTVEFFDYACRLPNLGLISIAGSLPEHEVHIYDLVLVKGSTQDAIRDAIDTYNPQIIGLSAMTFQFDLLLRIASFIRSLDPQIIIAAGGYHATLMYTEITEQPQLPLDFLIRGEGEITVKELITTLEEKNPNFSDIKGISYQQDDNWTHNPPRDLIDVSQLPLPDRNSRIANSFYFFNKSFDVIETSRGCPNSCNFCCITQMYGRSFRAFPLERVIEDIKQIKANGTKAIFIIDDNITHSIEHFKNVCRAIIDNNLNTIEYLTQVAAAGIANNPDLVELMEKANFRIVFVGFESMDPEVLKQVKKPTSPKINRAAAKILRKHNIGIIAGTIVGFPEDTRESVKKQLQQIRSLTPDAIYVQYLTPYPKTQLREDLLEAGLVVIKDDYSKYNGFSCVVKTKHMSREELYRAKKIECFKPYFNLKMIWNNYFLRNSGKEMVINELKNIKMLISNVIRGKQQKNKLDI